MRILIFGNSGSGKTTMARELAREHALAHLDLDTLAWDPGPTRRPIEASAASIVAFVEEHDRWVIEGSYGELVELVTPDCTELIFLNPGVEACVANCLARPWEPEKYASSEEQDARLEFLISWVRAYETRSDEFSLGYHRRIFEAHSGEKREIRGLRA